MSKLVLTKLSILHAPFSTKQRYAFHAPITLKRTRKPTTPQFARSFISAHGQTHVLKKTHRCQRWRLALIDRSVRVALAL